MFRFTEDEMEAMIRKAESFLGDICFEFAESEYEGGFEDVSSGKEDISLCFGFQIFPQKEIPVIQ